MLDNAFFRIDDPRVDEIAGHKLLPAWWSRAYEYPWGLQFARPGDIVMDAGCGHNFRPFKDALAQIVDQVYAVDADREVLQQTPAPKMSLVWADFTQRIPLIGYEELDRVFCISVLEDLEKGDLIEPALREFARVLKPDGKMILTFDVPYDEAKECKSYPGLNLKRFVKTVDDLGVAFEGSFDLSKENAVVHTDYNLCVFHAVIVRP